MGWGGRRRGNPVLPSGLHAGMPSNSFALKFSINQTNLSVLGFVLGQFYCLIFAVGERANETGRYNNMAANQHVKHFIRGGGLTKARGI